MRLDGDENEDQNEDNNKNNNNNNECIYIPLGPNWHATKNLIKLGFRDFCYPFDWLLTNADSGIEYVTNNINNNFKDFTKNLAYNKYKQVYSINYPDTIFFHHNLFKNLINGKPAKYNLLKKYGQGAQKFMKMIKNENNEIIFLYS